MLIIELRWLLLLLIGLPLLSIAATAGIIYWLDKRRRVSELIAALQPLLDHAPVGLFIVQKRSKLVYKNAFVQRMFEADIAETALLDFLTENTVTQRGSKHAAGYYRVLETDASLLSNTAKGRIRWWITKWNGTILAFLSGKTAEQKTEQKFNLMLGRLSHELRTPLETIASHLAVMRLPNVTDEQREQSLDYIKQETQRMTHLANSALELVQLETRPYLETELVDLASLVDGVVAQLSDAAQEKQIRLAVQADANLPDVVGSAGGLKQVFINVMNNSIAHCRNGDSVTIVLKRAPAGVACHIDDTGPGIASKHMARLTEPFFRAAAAGVQSTGLGLAIVAEILHQHQSRLAIESIREDESTPGQASGTSVRFVLPTAMEDEV